MTDLNRNMIDRLVLDMEQCSTDPDTQVGCVVTDTYGNILATGANAHTGGVEQTDENSARPEKYDWIEHAERNAIYSAARRGILSWGQLCPFPDFHALNVLVLLLNQVLCFCTTGLLRAGTKNGTSSPSHVKSLKPLVSFLLNGTYINRRMLQEAASAVVVD